MTKKSPMLEKLKLKQTKINNRIAKMEAVERTRERKRDTRRKILVGSFYLSQASSEKDYNSLVSQLDDFLTRPHDRALFGLEPKELPEDEVKQTQKPISKKEKAVSEPCE